MTTDYVKAFERWAAEKGVATKCEICGSESGWAVYATAQAHNVLPLGKDGDLFVGPYGIDALAMRCRNCANIRLFDLNAILESSRDVIEVRPLEGGAS